jgi:hypothetical protein
MKRRILKKKLKDGWEKIEEERYKKRLGEK